MVVGTAGHIDHGKSALVQALTGIDPDRLPEEKARGITIELGFAHARIGDLTVAFVDVPGHERFVRTMLAGAGGVDAVLLVVAADESVMPQTREHFEICRLLRVPLGVVVLTKADKVDEDTLGVSELEVRELVKGSFLEAAPVVPVSARTGQGLDRLRGELTRLAGLMVQQQRRDCAAVRLSIDRAFSRPGFGTVVTGTLVTGQMRVEQELLLLPLAQRVRVRGLQVHGQPREQALAGERTAVNLGGVELGDAPRGGVLVTPDTLALTRRIDARFELLPSARPLRHGVRVRVHQGTSDASARVVLANGLAELVPGESADVRLRLDVPMPLSRGDRFIVRAPSPVTTLGGGVVLDPAPPRTSVRSPRGAQRFVALSDSLEAAIAQMVADEGPAGLPTAALTTRAGVAPAEVPAALQAVLNVGLVRQAADTLVTTEVVRELAAELLALVARFHEEHPLAEGVPREEARERVFGDAPAPVFDLVLADLTAAGKLHARERLMQPGHHLALSAEEARALETLERLMRQGGLAPPEPAELASSAGVSFAVTDKLVALLVRQKRLVRITGLTFHVDAVQQLKNDIRSLKGGGSEPATVDVGTFKDRYGLTRKFAIPLLEWLDRERVTRRSGATRVVV